ncbi:hypothetical protein ERX46_01690 [Brumimicrobium glaciale]|uniref:Thoeris protein ThsB TIR-like domain-containing protein n=1 Tax=Brumimicrobium glaciale TaxID=200475 RepID=A0A4Q4KS19_9FLAO|nr:TIR domain-containing protein [Brumimicrobium glaciale]RYM35732.1 hypothetical protein ERX46_01690 [Brumimicrobium glaciale]
MSRRVFFSFNFEDVSDFKVNVVRNSRAFKNNGLETTFVDKSLWEEALKKSPNTIKTLIDIGMKGTSATTLLIGVNTTNRRWVNYEIINSFVEGKGILAIHLNRIRSRTTKKISRKGVNPLSRLKLRIDSECKKIYFYELKDGKWIVFKDIPFVNNRKTNSFYFRTGHIFRRSQAGSEYKFSELFDMEYCWKIDDGYKNFPNWVEKSVKIVQR